jgi:RHS repeat-associated protein
MTIARAVRRGDESQVSTTLPRPAHYNYYRDYDPSIGRYIEGDPIWLKGGLGLFLYGLANPLTNIDFRGESSQPIPPPEPGKPWQPPKPPPSHPEHPVPEPPKPEPPPPPGMGCAAAFRACMKGCPRICPGPPPVKMAFCVSFCVTTYLICAGAHL